MPSLPSLPNRFNVEEKSAVDIYGRKCDRSRKNNF
jgi:hypothetical protein